MNNHQPPILSGCTVLPPMNPRPKREPPPTKNKTKKSGKTGNRFAVLNNFVDFTMRDLKAADVRVWMVLYRDTKDGTARTAQSYIAKRAGISVRSVGESVRRLERLGLLKSVHQGGLNRGPSRYRVLPLTPSISR